MKKLTVIIGAGIALLLLAVSSYLLFKPKAIKVTMLTDKYVFSAVDNKGFIGEGFFATTKTGDEVFVYSVPEDDLTRIENIRRRFMAAAKGDKRITYSREKERRLYLATKYDLGAEHRLLKRESYSLLAEEVVRRGMSKKVKMVHFQDIQFVDNEVRFPCRDINAIDPVTMTTGGSTYLFTINRTDGESLNIGMSTKKEGAKDRLEESFTYFQSLRGTDHVIVARKLQYQQAIYTKDGIRSGWTVGLENVSVE